MSVWNTAPDPKGNDTPVSSAAVAVRQAHRAEGLWEPRVPLNPSETPAPAPGLKEKLPQWLQSSVPQGALRKPIVTLHYLHKSLLTDTWKQTSACLLFYWTKNVMCSPKGKRSQRNIDRKECFVSKKEKWSFLLSGPLIYSLHPTSFLLQLDMGRPVQLEEGQHQNSAMLASRSHTSGLQDWEKLLLVISHPDCHALSQHLDLRHWSSCRLNHQFIGRTRGRGTRSMISHRSIKQNQGYGKVY